MARARKDARFTALLHHITVELLEQSDHALNRKAAPGIDGVTWQAYGENLNEKLPVLHARIHRGSDRAQPARRTTVPKADGTERALSVLCLEDKIVQQAVVSVLEAIDEEDFVGFSYGYRPGRGQHDALDALSAGIYRKRVNWVLELDVRGFFDAMSHEWTVRFLRHRIADKRLRARLQVLKAELRKPMHDPIAKTGRWLYRVLQGHLNDFSVSGNDHTLWAFFHEVGWYWLRSPRRRSQRGYLSWEQFERHTARFFPKIRLLHPHPLVRFDARTRGRSPVR